MPTATTAGVAGVGAHAAPGASTARKIGEKVLKWQALQGCQRIPNPRSLDKHEKSLGKSFQGLLRRRYCAKMSADELHFINGISGIPPPRRRYLCSATPRKIGEKVLEWQVSQGCQRIPTRNSHDEHEKKLAKSFQDVLRRRYGAIGEKPCQQQLSADEIHFINGIPGVPLLGCSVNAASPGAIEADVPVGAHAAQPAGFGDALALFRLT